MIGQRRTGNRATGQGGPEVVACLEGWIKDKARSLGFDLVGIAPAEPLPEHERAAQERVRQGLLDGMSWFTQERIQRAANPQTLLPGAKTVVMVGLSYLPSEDDSSPSLQGEGPDEGESLASPEAPRPQEASLGLTGNVARYAHWTDYHTVMKVRLRELAAALEAHASGPIKARVFVDDGALLERAYAQRAGLGWFGKNTNILTSSHGSWVFLGALVTDLALEPDTPLKKTCGSCVRCMPACPTNAIVAPYVLDARRCISYLTIERRGPIPRELRPLMGNWVFGCDLCQEVCPVNRGALPSARGSPLERTGYVPTRRDLIPFLDMTPEEFSARFRDTPIRRAKLAGLQRNACVALGNVGDACAVSALGRALRTCEPMVRGHAAWALGRIGNLAARRLLEEALAAETDLWVQEELQVALNTTQRASEKA